MGFSNDLRCCIAFLTRLPVGNVDFDYKDLSTKTWLFSFVGLIVGLIAGAASMLFFRFLPEFLAGFLLLALLIFLTGGHHTDGLLDFGDGLMASGTPEHKVEVMHGVSVGTGGFVLAFSTLMLTGISISYLHNLAFIALIVAEIGAKLAMVMGCAIGRPIGTKLADPFIRNTHTRQLLLGLGLAVIFIYMAMWISELVRISFVEWSWLQFVFEVPRALFLFDLFDMGILIVIFLLGTFIPVLFVNRLANKNFNGLTGDCLGALNEITRAFILIMFILFGVLL